METYYDNIDAQAKKNTSSHIDVYTSPFMKIALLHLDPKGEIGMEVHTTDTQFIKIVEGVGLALIGEKTQVVNPGMALVIPPGTQHNIINVSATAALKMYTIYVHTTNTGSGPAVDLPAEDGWNMPYLPREMHDEVAFQGEVKDYIRMCMTDRGHWERCMVPGHWKTYMQGKSLEEAVMIVRFTLQYINEYPRLFQEVGNEFLAIHGERLRDAYSYKVTVRAKAKARAKTKAVDTKKSYEEMVADKKMVDHIDFLSQMIIDKKHKLVSVKYTVEKYGPIEDILTSDMLRKWMMLNVFAHSLKFSSPANKNGMRVIFIESFIKNIKIDDRSLDDKILGLFKNIHDLTQFDDESESDEEAEYDVEVVEDFFEVLFEYIENNFEQKKRTKIIKKFVDSFFQLYPVYPHNQPLAEEMKAQTITNYKNGHIIIKL